MWRGIWEGVGEGSWLRNPFAKGRGDRIERQDRGVCVFFRGSCCDCVCLLCFYCLYWRERNVHVSLCVKHGKYERTNRRCFAGWCQKVTKVAHTNLLHSLCFSLKLYLCVSVCVEKLATFHDHYGNYYSHTLIMGMCVCVWVSQCVMALRECDFLFLRLLFLLTLSHTHTRTHEFGGIVRVRACVLAKVYDRRWEGRWEVGGGSGRRGGWLDEDGRYCFLSSWRFFCFFSLVCFASASYCILLAFFIYFYFVCFFLLCVVFVCVEIIIYNFI